MSVLGARYSVAVGTSAGVAIGMGSHLYDRYKPDWAIANDKIDDRVKQLETLVEKQNEQLREQHEMLTALWYHPGMPGAQEAANAYALDSAKQ